MGYIEIQKCAGELFLLAISMMGGVEVPIYMLGRCVRNLPVPRREE